MNEFEDKALKRRRGEPKLSVGTDHDGKVETFS